MCDAQAEKPRHTPCFCGTASQIRHSGLGLGMLTPHPHLCPRILFAPALPDPATKTEAIERKQSPQQAMFRLPGFEFLDVIVLDARTPHHVPHPRVTRPPDNQVTVGGAFFEPAPHGIYPTVPEFHASPQVGTLPKFALTKRQRLRYFVGSLKGGNGVV